MRDGQAYEKILVAGAGAWGTALALLLSRTGHQVTIWSRKRETVVAINEAHANPGYLPGVRLPESLCATTDYSAAAEADGILFVVPAQYVREQIPAFRAGAGYRDVPVCLCSKGIERATGKLMDGVLAELWPEAGRSVLSGPSFAADVAAGLPTAVTLADRDTDRGARWLATLAGPTFRPYYTDDVRGAELGGALKNVLAIACGVVEGRGYGESAKAALITRGFAEILRFADAMGARSETLHGLSGLGDLILTCSSRQSRNMSLGYDLGQGHSADEVMAERNTVAEGAATAPILLDLATEHGVEMPICAAVAGLVAGEVAVEEVVDGLLARPLRHEAPSRRQG